MSSQQVKPMTKPAAVASGSSSSGRGCPAPSDSAHHRSCSSSPARRPPIGAGILTDQLGGEAGRPRWGGYSRGVAGAGTLNRRAVSQGRMTKIPTSRTREGREGKENLRGRRGGRGGAAPPTSRVVKPVSREAGRAGAGSQQQLRPDPDLKPASPPMFLKSKAFPDLHRKLLAKIKANKRKSVCRTLSPLKAPPSNEEVVSPGLQAEVDRESPVSCEDIDSYLEALFSNVDIYRYSEL